jgi:hypothetical protein
LGRFGNTSINPMKLLYRNGNILFLTRIPGIILFFFSLNNPLSFSQLPDKEKAKLLEKSFSEELFVRTDRDLYIAGEKVWLKIYKLNGLNHVPANLSKVVYIDLLDVKNNPVSQLKIGIDGNSGSCDFILPDTLSTGNYIIRSYTNWMQNFSNDLFSYKRISVINPFENINNIKIPSPGQIPDSLIFSPEGGHLIAGIETRIGFRSIGKNGDPVIMKGALIYENNDTICYIQTENNGYGWASIKPSGNNKIFLVTTNKSNPVKKFQLPEIQNEGISLSVTKESEKSPILARISLSQNFVSSGTKLYVSLQTAGLSSIKKEVNIENGHEINLLRKDFPDGLSHLMIIDENDNRLADRWIYNETDQGIIYNINIQNNTFPTREKIKVEISATDNKGAPVESDLSISIVKAFTLNKSSFDSNKFRQFPGLATITADISSPDINDYLICYPSHDFILNKDGIDNNSNPAYLPELEGHLISGNIRNRKSGEPLKNENITLSYVGKVALCQFTKTDEQGDFSFVTRDHGLREIVIQPLSPDIKDYYVDIYNPFNTTFNNYNHGLFYIDSSKLGQINNAIISMQIKNIYEPYSQQVVIKTGIPVKYDFYGIADNTVQMSSYIELTSLKEAVKELIPNVYTVKKNDNISFKLLNRNLSQPYMKDPLVLVDGVPVYDIEKILSVSSRDIEKIDVLFAKYYISDNVLEGILHFVTRKGNLGLIDLDRSVFRQEYELLQSKNEFSSPDYASVSMKEDRVPDFRNTLYWNPDLHTDNTGKTSIEFYSSDESGEYIINVEGITPDGKTGVSGMPLIIKSR